MILAVGIFCLKSMILATEIRSDARLPEVLEQMRAQGELGLKQGKAFRVSCRATGANYCR